MTPISDVRLRTVTRDGGNNPVTQSISEILHKLFQEYSGAPFAIAFADGTVWHSHAQERAKVHFIFPSHEFMRTLFLDADMLTLSRAYVDCDFDVDGDFCVALEVGDYILSRPVGRLEKIGRSLLTWLNYIRGRDHGNGDDGGWSPDISSDPAANRAIGFHYDLPIEFFAEWLDTKLVYSGAYFESEANDINVAQEDKLEHVCRKLKLSPGDRFLDCGCGWGALVCYACCNYGVKALGVTLSQSQADCARRRIRELGIENDCEIVLCDFRELTSLGSYDKIASIGMAEHILSRDLPSYYAKALELLRPDGLFLNQAIASNYHTPLRSGRSFMARYIFPETELVPVSTSLLHAEQAGFEVIDVEVLRVHYELTLRRWLERFEAAKSRIVELTSEATWRRFRIYLTGAVHDMTCGRIGLYQVLYSKPTGKRANLPLTRRQLYNSCRSQVVKL